MFFKFCLEALEQGERVCRAARKAGQKPVVIQAPYFARRRLDDNIAKGYLAIAPKGDFAVSARAQDGGAVELFHGLGIEVQSALTRTSEQTH